MDDNRPLSTEASDRLFRMEKANICGERIKEARAKLQLSQIDIAAELEVEYGIKLDRSDISEIERGVRGVKDYELLALSRTLRVSTDWLLEG